MKNIAVILAGGSGKRFGGDKPKQLLPLSDGRSVLEHAVGAFRACPCISDVLVVMHPDYIDEVSALLGCTVVPGGRERWESSVHAIEALQQSVSAEEWADVNILIHDAARPFVSSRIITDVCEALLSHEAVTVAVPSTDTVYRLSPDGCVAEIPDRSTIMRAQTPQAFRLPLIAEAYRLALQDPALQATDDCGILFRYIPSAPIHIVSGEEQNRKITFPSDL
ncbi:MAG: 2-C-methyl-D-erythritol 4-phosphate cytidylyltransferase [Bacteroidales bacterium]|nr:2-C-methyl-D-erythritol 4-phosphate cytidylyltransferase [Candidatus Colicola faecequi]